MYLSNVALPAVESTLKRVCSPFGLSDVAPRVDKSPLTQIRTSGSLSVKPMGHVTVIRQTKVAVLLHIQTSLPTGDHPACMGFLSEDECFVECVCVTRWRLGKLPITTMSSLAEKTQTPSPAAQESQCSICLCIASFVLPVPTNEAQ